MSTEQLTTLDISGPIIKGFRNFSPETAPQVIGDTIAKLGGTEEEANAWASQDAVKVRVGFLMGSIDAVAMSPVANRAAKLQVYGHLTDAINVDSFNKGSAGLCIDGRKFITKRLRVLERELFNSSLFQGESVDNLYEEVSMLRVHAARELPRMSPEQRVALIRARQIRKFRNSPVGKAMPTVELVNIIGDMEERLNRQYGIGK